MPPIGNQPNAQDIESRLFALIRKLSDADKRKLLEQLEGRDRKSKERMHLRTLCYAKVDFFSRETPHKGAIQDMSCSGMFIETEDPFSVGQRITLEVDVDAQEPRTITGEVVRTEIRGIGVKFSPMDHDLLSEYQKSLQKKTGRRPFSSSG